MGKSRAAWLAAHRAGLKKAQGISVAHFLPVSSGGPSSASSGAPEELHGYLSV